MLEAANYIYIYIYIEREREREREREHVQWYDFRFIVANNIKDYGWKYSDLNKIIRHFEY